MTISAVLEVPYHIALAISIASTATGADFDYLVKTAARESGFQESARASTSSARGLFQFIEGTWLRTLKEHGPRFGLQEYADLIERREDGRFGVRRGGDRAKILALRNDPKISALMAGAFTRKNAEVLREGLRRTPSAAELYMAHFLGAGDAVKLIRLSRDNAREKAHLHFRAASRANRSIFFSGGRARTVREVYRLLKRKYDRRAHVRGAHRAESWHTLVVHRNKTKAAERKVAAAVERKSPKLGRAGRNVKVIGEADGIKSAASPASRGGSALEMALRGSMATSAFRGSASVLTLVRPSFD